MRVLPIELLHLPADRRPLLRVPTRRAMVRKHRPCNRKKTSEHRINRERSILHPEPSRGDVLARTLFFIRKFVKRCPEWVLPKLEGNCALSVPLQV